MPWCVSEETLKSTRSVYILLLNMSTPILTKKQQRHSLSAKKGPVKGLRNILAQPFENYWPVVNVDQYPTLVTLMNELLPLIKRSTFKIPGSMLRIMTKEKRILARKEQLEKETDKLDVNLLKSVILGINAVTRTLEKNNACCILLDANVEPPLLIKHIVVMAQNKKVPILLLPILKTVTLQRIGFATAAIALKHDVMQSSDNKFHALYKLVAEVFKNFQPPKCSLQLFKPDETSEESALHEMKITGADCDPACSNTSKSKKSVTVFTDVYKYRSSRNERAFVPPSVDKNSKVAGASTDDFIALSSDVDLAIDNNFTQNISKNRRYVNIHEKDESENTKRDSNKSFNESKLIDNSVDSSKRTGNDNRPKKRKSDDVTYLSLKVKRVQGNSSRTKATKFVKKKKK